MSAGPHTAPRTAVVWAVLREELSRVGRPLTAVDVGGGTGGFAVPLARDGHRVTVVDASPDALAALTRRAADAGVADLIEAVQGDADALTGVLTKLRHQALITDLLPAGGADLVLCHSLLEVVDDPGKTVGALFDCLRPGGVASVLVANRVAAVLARAIGGQLRSAVDLLTDPAGALPKDRLRRRFDRPAAVELLTGAGLLVEQVHGVRIVADLMPGAVAEAEQDALLEFELAAAAVTPYRDLATQLHLFARRPA
mgnify:CR=1 FL=1